MNMNSRALSRSAFCRVRAAAPLKLAEDEFTRAEPLGILPCSRGSPIEARFATHRQCLRGASILPCSRGSPIEAARRRAAWRFVWPFCRVRAAAPLKRRDEPQLEARDAPHSA